MTAEELWSKFIEKHPEEKNTRYETWHFCNNEKDANELAELTVKGTKTATAGAYYWYENGDPLPKAGDYSVILKWNREAVCIIKATKITIVPFNEVSAEQAYKEGEGDRSLAYWREVHQRYFKAELAEVNVPFEENMNVMCEEFEIVYK